MILSLVILLKPFTIFGSPFIEKNFKYASSYFPKKVLHFLQSVLAVRPFGYSGRANSLKNLSF